MQFCTNYPELGQTTQVTGTVIQKIAFNLDTSHKHDGYQATETTGYKFGGSHYSLKLLEYLTELRKVLYLGL